MSDVARLAGVSIKTVSRVVNDEPAVHPDTAERVVAAIADANRDVGVTACYGVAEFTGGDWSDLHATADSRMLTAKRGRR
jgi:hypothetical protein